MTPVRVWAPWQLDANYITLTIRPSLDSENDSPRLSKRQSPTTVLFRTILTRTITLYELLILLGSNHLLRTDLFLKRSLGSSRNLPAPLGEGRLRDVTIERLRMRPRPRVSWNFLIRNFFFPDSKISPSPRSVYQIEFPRPPASDGIRIHSSTQGSSALKFLQSMRRRARWWREICSVSPTRCSARLDTLFTSSDSKISGFTRPQVIGFVADLFFSTLESRFSFFFRFRCRIRRMRVNGSRIRKEIVAVSKISGYVWTGPESKVELEELIMLTLFQWLLLSDLLFHIVLQVAGQVRTCSSA